MAREPEYWVQGMTQMGNWRDITSPRFVDPERNKDEALRTVRGMRVSNPAHRFRVIERMDRVIPS